MALPPEVALKVEKTESQKLRTRWLRELELSHNHEKTWRERGRKVVERYRDERKSWDNRDSKFNVLYANTEILKNSTYAKPPIPIVRRRWDSQNVVGVISARIIERGISYNNECVDIDETLRSIVEDMYLPGRGVAKVRYEPEMVSDEQRVEVTEEDALDTDKLPPVIREGFQKDDKGYFKSEPFDRVVYEKAPVDYIDWKWFRYSPATSWKKVRWVAFGELLTRDECVKTFGKTLGRKIKLTWKPTSEEEEGEQDRDAAKARALVWTIWNKPDKTVYIVSDGYDDGVISRQDDPLRLENFFPCPEPVYDIKTNGSLIPIPNFTMYQDQADELDELTARISILVSALKRRGVYDASMPELERLSKAGDNVFIPIENMAALKEKGGLETAFMSEPIQGIAQILIGLYQQREQCMNIINQVVGIGDIMRSASKSSETLGAQELKVQYGSLRIKNRQTSIQKFALNVMRLQGEVIAEHFSPETLAAMTGVQLPTGEQKAQAQQQHQMAAMQAQQTGQQPPPAPKEAQLPSWDEVMALLRNDKMRGFNLEIETDSTIALNEAEEQEGAAKMVAAMGQIGSQLAPAVKEGFIPAEAAKAIVKFTMRKFRASREVEDEIEKANFEPKPAEQDPAAMAEVQLKQQEMQATQQMNAQKMQMEQQNTQIQMQTQQQDAQNTLELERAKLQFEQAKLESDIQQKQIALQMQQQEMTARLALEREKMIQDSELALQKAQLDAQTKIQIEQMKLEASNEQDIKHVEGMMKEAQTKDVEKTSEESNAGVMKALTELMEKLNKPKKVDRDNTGKISGIHTVQ